MGPIQLIGEVYDEKVAIRMAQISKNVTTIMSSSLKCSNSTVWRKYYEKEL